MVEMEKKVETLNTNRKTQRERERERERLALKKRWKLGELEAGRKDWLRRSFLRSSMVL